MAVINHSIQYISNASHSIHPYFLSKVWVKWSWIARLAHYFLPLRPKDENEKASFICMNYWILQLVLFDVFYLQSLPVLYQKVFPGHLMHFSFSLHSTDLLPCPRKGWWSTIDNHLHFETSVCCDVLCCAKSIQLSILEARVQLGELCLLHNSSLTAGVLLVFVGIL